MNEFLNPKSMLTPGVAGGLVMLITNSLTSQFLIPANVTAMVISFTLGLVIFLSMEGKIGERLLFYVLNSLIVFSVATGTNSIGAKIQASEEAHAWAPTFISEAYAQPAPMNYDALIAQLNSLKEENRLLRQQLSALSSISDEMQMEQEAALEDEAQTIQAIAPAPVQQQAQTPLLGGILGTNPAPLPSGASVASNNEQTAIAPPSKSKKTSQKPQAPAPYYMPQQQQQKMFFKQW